MLRSNGRRSLCRFDLVIGNNNNRSRHRHSESTIESKGSINSWSLHSWHNTRGESHLFGFMLHSACLNHQLWFVGQPKNNYTGCDRVLSRARRNRGNCARCNFAPYYDNRDNLGYCILCQKASQLTRAAGVSKPSRKRPINIIIAFYVNISTFREGVQWWRKCKHHIEFFFIKTI